MNAHRRFLAFRAAGRPLAAAAVALGLLAAFPARAQGPFDMEEDEGTEERRGGWGDFRVRGLMDLRAARTTDRRSWAYHDVAPGGGDRGGLNKLRFGGRDTDLDGRGDSPASLISIPQAIMLAEAEVPSIGRAVVHLNWDADFETGNGSVGVIEGYAEAQRAWDVHAARLRAGAFYPPISWEHTELAWTTRYSLTPSAFNSWVGEDTRGIGLEGAWNWRPAPGVETRLIGSVFSGCDQSGWVLLERGWALHDYQLDLNAVYPLQTAFEGVVLNRPFKEYDGRLGWYGQADVSLASRMVELRGGVWDNRGDETAQFLGSHLDVYSTRVYHGGVKVSYRRAELFGQYATGGSEHHDGAFDGLGRKDFQTWYALASYEAGRLRATARWDDFEVDGLEEGDAFTAALAWRLGLRNALTLEYAGYEADRAAPPPGPSGGHYADHLVSLNLRVRYGD